MSYLLQHKYLQVSKTLKFTNKTTCTSLQAVPAAAVISQFIDNKSCSTGINFLPMSVIVLDMLPSNNRKSAVLIKLNESWMAIITQETIWKRLINLLIPLTTVGFTSVFHDYFSIKSLAAILITALRNSDHFERKQMGSNIKGTTLSTQCFPTVFYVE